MILELIFYCLNEDFEEYLRQTLATGEWVVDSSSSPESVAKVGTV